MRQGRVTGKPPGLKITVLLQQLLLGFDDDLVLKKSLKHDLSQGFTHIVLALAEVPQVLPEKMRGVAGLRRHVLAISKFQQFRALRRAVPTLRTELGVHEKDAGGIHAHKIPPVDHRIRWPRGNFLQVGRLTAGPVPAFKLKAVVQFIHCLGRLLGVVFGSAQGIRMHKGEMGEIGQIVHNQHPVGVVVQITTLGQSTPVGILKGFKVRNILYPRLLRLTHPDPEHAAPINQGVTAHPVVGTDLRLTRNLHALAGGVVLHAVVHTAYAVTLYPAHRQGC